MKKILKISLILTLLLTIISFALKVTHTNFLGISSTLFLIGFISMGVTILLAITFFFSQLFKG